MKKESVEIEVKFPVEDLPSLRRNIKETGAISKGRHFEVNVRFDDAGGRLQRANSLLRLRRDRQNLLTFKSASKEKDRQFKVHKELEVQVSDFDTMEQILGSLGFARRQVYEKWRETFALDETAICLDQMPFGDYLEIEGPREAIRRVASRLGFDWNRRILRNYLEMFSMLRSHLKLPFSDITFENFENVTLHLDHQTFFA